MEPAGVRNAGGGAGMRLLARCAMALVMTGATAIAAPLELVRTIPLPGVKGRIDHLAFDVKGGRLFVAALGNDTVEVIDTRASSVRTLRGFGEPQGVLFAAGSNRAFVANGSADRVDVLDGSTLAPLAHIDRMADADNVRHDDAARQVVVGYGDGALRFLDEASGETAYEVELPAHPESFQLEKRGTRAFVNVPASRSVVVIDRATRKAIATWETAGASANFPMALDEDEHRLYVGARSPPLLLAYDSSSGQVVAKVAIGRDTDDVFVDGPRKRIYVVCGEGRVDVVRRDEAGHYAVEASVPTAPGARTGLFVPDQDRLYVAAPARGSSAARILVYRP